MWCIKSSEVSIFWPVCRICARAEMHLDTTECSWVCIPVWSIFPPGVLSVNANKFSPQPTASSFDFNRTMSTHVFDMFIEWFVFLVVFFLIQAKQIRSLMTDNLEWCSWTYDSYNTSSFFASLEEKYNLSLVWVMMPIKLMSVSDK